VWRLVNCSSIPASAGFIGRLISIDADEAEEAIWREGAALFDLVLEAIDRVGGREHGGDRGAAP
jgi:hypothetical protein